MSAGAAFLLGWVCSACATLLVHELRRAALKWRKSKAAKRQVRGSGSAPPAHTEPIAQQPAAAAPIDDGWYALVGGKRMEYKASGFAIELHPEQRQAPYRLFTPEGEELGGGPHLIAIKLAGAFAAGERAQFSPSGKGGAQ